MAKTNPSSANNSYMKDLSPQQRIAMALNLTQEPISKGFSPYAGSPAIIGNSTIGYHSISPRLYGGMSGAQLYGLMGLTQPQDNGRLTEDELSGTNGSLSDLLDKFKGQPEKIARVLSSVFNLKPSDYNYTQGQTGGFDNGGIVNA